MVLPRHALPLEHEHSPLRIELGPLVEGFLDDGASRQPGRGVVVQVALKLLPDAQARLAEPGVLGRLRLVGVAGPLVVPVGVQAADDGAQREAALAVALLEPRGGDAGRVVDADAVVVGVEGLDEALVQLVVQQVDLGGVLGHAGAELLGDDGPAEVLEDEARAGELGAAAGEGGGEAALVVVVAVALGVVLAADVDDGVTGCEEVWVARADERRVVVGWEHAQHVHCQRFVGVEVPVVGADLGAGLEAFGGGLGHGCDEATEHKLVAGYLLVFLFFSPSSFGLFGEAGRALAVGGSREMRMDGVLMVG